MTYSVKIVGCGSIGNHLANAARFRNWNVTMCDIDQEAIRRTVDEIYPSRYGAWDPEIKIGLTNEFKTKKYDVVVVGTPPDTHIQIAQEEIKSSSPKIIMIEKPLSDPGFTNFDRFQALAQASDCRLLVAYNHRLTPVIQYARKYIADQALSGPLTIRSMTREDWSGILKAHHWLKTPFDSYLGNTKAGGGALLEHSHALNMFLYFAQILNCGEVSSVSAMLDFKTSSENRYDQIAQLSLRTTSGLVGLVEQDVITKPGYKGIWIEFPDRSLRIIIGSNSDEFRVELGSETITKSFPKKRVDDFLPEIDHLTDLLNSKTKLESPIDISYGIKTMEIIKAAIDSDESGQATKIN